MIEVVLIAYVVIGLCVAHAVAIRRRPRTTGALVQLVAIDLCVVTVTAVALVRPAIFDDWMQEDRWAEWATFFAFLIAGVALFWFLRRTWRNADELGWLPLGRVGFILLGLFCLVVAGEEISWGQRLFGFLPPEVFLKHNFQQELNVHNFLTGRFDTKHQVAILAVLYGVLLPWVARIPRFRETRVGRTALACAPVMTLSPWFAAVALAEVSYPITRTGEAAELLFGLLFVAEATRRLGSGSRLEPAEFKAEISRPAELRGKRRLLMAPAAVAVTLVLGIIAQPILARVLYGSDEQAISQTRSELVLLKIDLSLPGAFPGRNNIHKRVFTSVLAGYVRLGRRSLFLEGMTSPVENTADDRRDRRGYFLDPWKNPYWVRYRRRERRGLIYSFGPNRRRDTNTKEAVHSGELGGDDIGVVFVLR